MDWAKQEAEKETILYNQQKEKVSVFFSPLARIPLEETRMSSLLLSRWKPKSYVILGVVNSSSVPMQV